MATPTTNPTILTQFASPDPNAAPLDIAQLVALLNILVSSSLQGGPFTPYIISSTAPGVEDQNKAWIELDSGGRPISTKIFYNGTWRRIYNGMVNEIRMFSGDPTITTQWDANGLGVSGGPYDGWQICNGLNGSPDLSDSFIIAAHMNNKNGHVGYSGGWQTFVDAVNDSKNGGNVNGKLTLTIAQVPRNPESAANAWKWSASGNAPDPNGDLLGLHNSGSALQRLWDSSSTPSNPVLLQDDQGNPVPPATLTPVSILPPFIAMGYIIFLGYDIQQ